MHWSGYSIVRNTNGSVTVSDAAGAAVDGTDTLFNVELLQFTDQTISAVPAAAPAAALWAASLTLGSVATLSTSAAQTVTVTNTGNAPLVVTGVTTSDPQFVVTNGCTTVAPTSTCSINVAFAPTSIGAKTATLNIASNAAGSPASVALTGTGTAPVVAISPASLAFGSVTNGTTATQTITVGNTGNAPLTVSSVGLTGANVASFTATPSGCAPVAAGGSCTISVVFTATAGAKSATVVINHNSNNVLGTVTSVNLTGTGVAAVAAPRVAMPATLNFGQQRINQNRTQTLTVNNQGPGALLITTVTTSGGVFTATRGNCPTSLAAGRNCKLNVTFRPLVAGQAYAGTVTVNSNASNSPTSSALTGTGR